MDLEAYLQTNSDLYTKYEDIKRACTELWADVKLPWFTDHTRTHSARLVGYLNQILASLEGTPHVLTIQECFILLASCYLHEISNCKSVWNISNRLVIIALICVSIKLRIYKWKYLRGL